MNYANWAFDNYVPYVDYNANSIKVVNSNYLQYLKDKKL